MTCGEGEGIGDGLEVGIWVGLGVIVGFAVGLVVGDEVCDGAGSLITNVIIQERGVRFQIFSSFKFARVRASNN